MSIKKITLINEKLLQSTDTDLRRSETDLFRNKFGSWSSRRRGIRFEPKTPSDIGIVEIADPIRRTDPNGFVKLEQKVTVVQKDAPTYDPAEDDEWASKVRRLLKPGQNLDYVTTSITSITAEEIRNAGFDLTDSSAGVEYVYNFLDNAYERRLSSVKEHSVIPSIHDISTRALKQDTEENILRSIGVKELRRNLRRARRLRKLTNQIIPIENNKFLRQTEDNKYLLPMYVEVKVPMDRKNEIANAFSESKLGVMLIRDIQQTGLSTVSLGAKTTYYAFTYLDTDGNKVVDNFSTRATTVDLMDWWAYDAPGWAVDAPLPRDFSFVGPEADSATLSVDQNGHSLAIGLDILLNRLNSLYKHKKRTFLNLIRGKRAYSETLMYKISKFRGTNTSRPIQTFHFMNSKNISETSAEDKVMRFVDSQVKYGQQYTYLVTAYQVVLGSKYLYKNVKTFEPSAKDGFPDNRWATFDVEIEPSIKLVEIPLFMSRGKVLDSPPMPPDLNFIPLFGQPRKLMVFFNTSAGMVDEEPIPLSEVEKQDYEQISFNQKRIDGKVGFKSDDFATAFRIYRVSKPPTDYLDFSNALLKVVATNGRARPGQSSTRPGIQAASVTTILKQAPNRKFYYMFRTVDFHGNLSNPSPVYEIELYSDGGVGYPIIRLHKFSQANPKTTTKSARKIIQILPRLTQSFLNEEASGLKDEEGNLRTAAGKRDILLGLEDERLFGKRFKIRLTSKSTGKKLDFNVEFKTKRVRGEIE